LAYSPYSPSGDFYCSSYCICVKSRSYFLSSEGAYIANHRQSRRQDKIILSKDLGIHKTSSNVRGEILSYRQRNATPQPFIICHKEIQFRKAVFSMEGGKTLSVGYWVAALFIIVAVFYLPLAKGGLVNLTWWMTILQSLTRCSTGRSIYL
jgi:hypothetical protein